MTNAPFRSLSDFRDVESLNHHADAVATGTDADQVLEAMRTMSRDNARTPMQWDDGPHAGFTSGEPWLPVNPNYRQVNAKAARSDPSSVFAHYRRLVDLRHDEPVVAHGDFTMLLPDDERVYAFTRQLDDVELLVLGNFTGEPVHVDLLSGDGWHDAPVLLTNIAGGASGAVLEPWEARVLRRDTGSAGLPID